MTLQALEWEKFKIFLVVKCHFKDTLEAMYSNKSRFNKVKEFFRVKEFDEDGLYELLAEMQAKGCTGQYQNKIISIAKNIDDYLKLGVLTGFKYQPVEPPPEEELPTQEEVVAMTNSDYPYKRRNLDYLHLRDRALMKLISVVGPRPGEVCNIKWSDIQEEGSRKKVTFRGTKKKKDVINRKVFLPNHVWDAIQEIPRKSEYVFTSYRYKKLSTGALNEILKDKADYLGIKKNIHGHLFRHQCITECIDSGMDWFRLSVMVGHADPKTTRAYYDGSLKSQEELLKKHPLNREHIVWDDVRKEAFGAVQEWSNVSICHPTISEENNGDIHIILKKAVT